MLPRQITCIICREEIPGLTVVNLGKWVKHHHSSISHYSVHASNAISTNPLYGNAYYRTRMLLGLDPYKFKSPNTSLPTGSSGNNMKWCSKPFRLTKKMREVMDIDWIVPRGWLENNGIPIELARVSKVTAPIEETPVAKPDTFYKKSDWTSEQRAELRKWRSTPCRYGVDNNGESSYAHKRDRYSNPHFITGWK